MPQEPQQIFAEFHTLISNALRQATGRAERNGLFPCSNI
jgi:hypothetical protein